MRKLLIVFLMLVALAFSVSAAGNLTVTPATASHTGNISESITGTLTLENADANNNLTVTFPETVSFDAGTNSNITNMGVTYKDGATSLPSVVVVNGVPKEINYTFTVQNKYAEQYDNGFLNFTTNQAGSYDDLVLDLTVNPEEALTVTAATLNVKQGTTGILSANVANSGNFEVDITSTSYGTFSKSESLNLSAPTVSDNLGAQIAFGESDDLNLTFDILPNQSIGEYKTDLVIEYDGKNVTKELKVNVQQRNEKIAVSTSTADFVLYPSQTNAANVEFTLKNDGDVPLAGITMEATDFIGTNENVSSTGLTTSSFDLDAQEEKNETLALSLYGDNHSLGTYTATLTVHFPKYVNNAWITENETFELKFTTRTPQYEFSVTGDTSFPESERNVTVSRTFTVANTGDYDINNLNVTFSGSSTYNVSVSEISPAGKDLSHSNDESTTVTVTAFVPLNQNSGQRSIGELKFTSNEYNKSFNIYENARSKLDIKAVDVKVDGDKDKNVADNAVVKYEAVPGSEVEITVEIENLFTDAEDLDIDNIETTITFKDFDDEDDEEFELDELDISANDDKAKSVEFVLPIEIESGNHKVIIEVEGEDDKNARHYVTKEITIEVEKSTHDLRITKAELGSSTLRCVRSTTLNVKIQNLGEKDEDEIMLKILSSDLGLDITEKYLELDADSGDEWSKSYPISLSDEFATGVYNIEVSVYHDKDEIDDISTAKLTIDECSEEEEEVIVTPTTGTGDTDTTGGEVTIDEELTETTETGFADSGMYVVVLAVIMVVMLVAIIWLGAKYLI